MIKTDLTKDCSVQDLLCRTRRSACRESPGRCGCRQSASSALGHPFLQGPCRGTTPTWHRYTNMTQIHQHNTDTPTRHRHTNMTQIHQQHLTLVCWPFIISCGKFELPYLGKATTFTRAGLPIPTSVCRIFVSKQWYGCQCLGFLTCAQMLMYMVAHGMKFNISLLSKDKKGASCSIS